MKKILLILVAFSAFSFSGILTHFYNRTDDLSLRYILWKNNLYLYPSDIIWQSLIADSNRNDLIHGKSKEEIKRIFLTAHEESINDYQKMYERELSGKDYLWLGDWGVVFLFEKGLGKEVKIMKG